MSSIWTLRRSRTDAKLAGLCGALAARWGVDPTLVRVGCAVLALCSGVGVVLYLAGWLLLPVEGQVRTPADDLLGEQARKWPKELWLALVVLASLLALGIFRKVSPFGFGPAMILALLWYFGYYKNRGSQPAGGAPPPAPAVSSPPVAPAFTFPGPSTPFTQAAEAWRQRIVVHAEHAEQAAAPEEALLQAQAAAANAPDQQSFWSHPDPVGLYAEPETPVAPDRRKALPARQLRLLGLVVLGVVLAGVGAADLAGAAVTATTYLAAALLVVGLTLVAATWWGRARGILPVGLILALALGSTAVAGPAVDRVSTAERSYVTATDLPPAGDSLNAGRLQVDLRRLPVTRDLRYTAHVDLGTLEVRVPREVAVRIDYRIADGGTMLAYDQEVATGNALDDTVDPADLTPGTPVLTLVLSVDRGAIRVSR